MGKYDDIIALPHHVSQTRRRMSNIERAAQFSPFAALTGYDAAIAETARLTDTQTQLSDDRKEILNAKLLMLADMAGEAPEVSITYFRPDERKEGGEYVTARGKLKKIDEYSRSIVLAGGESIAIDFVREIECDNFSQRGEWRYE